MMTVNPHDPQLTDTEIASEWAIEAARAGRLELAEAALRIAMAAQRDERRGKKTVHVPLLGQTRSETPRLRTAAPAGPTGDGDADLQREAAQLAPGATAVIPMPTGEQISTNEGARCSAKVLKGNVYAECHGALMWMPATTGGPAGAFVEAHWAHVDRVLEQEHQASV